MRIEELRSMGNNELYKRANELFLEIAKMRSFKHGAGCSNVAKARTGKISFGMVKQLRKERAEILFILNERAKDERRKT